MTCNCSKLCAQMPIRNPNRQNVTAIRTRKATIAIGCATDRSTNRCAVANITSPTITDFVAAAPT